MQKRSGRTNKDTQKRRRQIIESALECFSRTGLIDTTMEEIRLRAGVSNGSLYHHFRSKEQLAAAVYLEGIIDFQKGMLEALRQSGTARDGIYAVVAFHLGWVCKYPEWARYLFQTPNTNYAAELAESMAAANREFFLGMEGCFEKYIKVGILKDLPPAVRLSIIIGSCQEYARLILGNSCETNVETAISQIGESIWQALKA